jgi:hypothetical protein
LSKQLAKLGWDCHHIAQEHSYVPNMWLRITNPDFLIYLQVSYTNTLHRRNLNWTEAEYQEQLYRLRHARENADLIVETDALSEEDVVRFVLDALQSSKLFPKSLFEHHDISSD